MNSIPFTTEQFLEVFKDYNLAVWPMPVVLNVMGVFAIFLGTRKAPASDKVVTFILAFFWLWMGGMYHISFFAEINKAAYMFGALFVVQAAMFYYHKKDLVFRFHRDVYGITGTVLMFFALVIYPVWSDANGHDFPAIPTFGLPCPTTIFTFGMLLWTDKKCPPSLLAIPLLWSLIGFSAVVLFGMTEDTALLAAALTAATLLIRRERQVAV